MAEKTPLICAFDIDGSGSATPVGWGQLAKPAAKGKWRWVHLERLHELTTSWLRNQKGIDEIEVNALLESNTRPRCTAMRNGTLVILRGVNLNPGADPHDMVSVRAWFGGDRVITLRNEPLMAINDIREQYENVKGPADPAELLADMVLGLTERMAATIHALEDGLDDLEEVVADTPPSEMRESVISVRKQAIPLRRYLSPQRDALAQLMTLRADWIDEWQRARIREVADRVTRYIEDLDAVRERAGILQEEIANRVSETMNKNMYVMSIIAAIFLPLGLLTGLLGINVGGIPGSESASGFLVFCALMIGVAAFEIWLFKKLKWL